LIIGLVVGFFGRFGDDRFFAIFCSQLFSHSLLFPNIAIEQCCGLDPRLSLVAHDFRVFHCWRNHFEFGPVIQVCDQSNRNSFTSYRLPAATSSQQASTGDQHVSRGGKVAI
jgi:hypothetical protein